MSIDLAHITRTYDVEYKGNNYLLIRSVDINLGFLDTQILLDGEEVDDEIFEEVDEYFKKEASAGKVEF